MTDQDRYWIMAGIPMTRRLKLHYVFDQAHTLRFTASDLSAALLWVSEQGEKRVQVFVGGASPEDTTVPATIACDLAVTIVQPVVV